MRSNTRRHRARIHQQRRQRRVTLMFLSALLLTVGSGGATFEWLRAGEAWPTVETLKPDRIGENSVVYAVDGTRMGVIQSDQNRTKLPLGKMGHWAPLAVVAIEDRRYYTHNGIDAEGIARAAMNNAKAGRVVEGGSTITQQVVRNLYKEITQEKTLRRKAKEATLAEGLEDRWSKKRILETYLNLVFFGNNAYGIEAAAQTYFSKHANDLSLPEAAMLAGLPQKPSEFDPFADTTSATERRNQVLRAMFNQQMITERQYREAVNTPVQLKAGKIYTVRRLPYFFDFVEKELIAKYGRETVRAGGLRVHTTIDPHLQKLAEQAIKKTLYYPDDPAAALVAIDTKTGEIKAMASSADYKQSKFNLAAQGRRQPGSSAKTWVLAAFVKDGINPESTYYSSRPIRVPDGSGEYWEPKTYDHSYVGSISVANATVRSDNSVYAQMVLDIGAKKVSDTARDLGIKSPLQNVWSIGLGSQVVTPLEQTNAYATIARGGVRVDPTAVEEVTGPAGRKKPLPKPKRERVLEDWQAREIISILERNVEYGTGTGADIGRPSAGKTGTTDEHNDAWYCGMTPELTACVWMGYPDAMQSMSSVHGIRVAGGTFPATIWREFMSPALKDKPVSSWFEPRNPPVWVPFTSTWQSKYEQSYTYDPYSYTAPSTSAPAPAEPAEEKPAKAPAKAEEEVVDEPAAAPQEEPAPEPNSDAPAAAAPAPTG